ncbi:MAG: SIMPL domain-containing protein [Parvularculaceae bacterium]
MKRLIIVPLAGLLFGCLPQDEPKQIIVDGEATIEVEPEIFNISGTIRARKDTARDALAEISERLARIRETLPNLEALEKLNIEASEAEIRPIQDAECVENSRYRFDAMCPVTGYFGSIGLKIKGSPAQLSGQVLSLLSELGAESVSLNSYSVEDMDAAHSRALEAAVADAREKAAKIAGAANAVLVGPTRIQFGEGFGDQRVYARYAPALDQIVVTGSKVVQPEIDLDLDPQPISIASKVVAAFEIE